MNLDKINSATTVELGGQTYELAMTMHSLAQYKRLTGQNLMESEVNPKDPESLIALLWVSLITKHPEFDGRFVNGLPDEAIQSALEKLGRLMAFDELDKIGTAIGRLFQANRASKDGSKSGKNE